MNEFKFFRGKSDLLIGYENFQPSFITQPLFIAQQRIEDCEFCFQFNDDEPVVFANGNGGCNITIGPTTDGNVTFTNNNNTFKIFARERQ